MTRLTESTILLPDQRKDEHVVFFLRRHWIRFAPVLLAFALALVVPLLAGLFVPGLLTAVVDRTLLGVGAVFGGILVWLFSALLFLHAWVEFYLDAWIVTDQRIVAVNQRALFSRAVAELQLENIQDVTVDVDGALPTMLRFGDVHIQTAGEVPRFHFDDIPDPYGVARRIMELHQAVARRTGT